MTPARARALLMVYFGKDAATFFDPDWPETMLQLSPGAQPDQVFTALRTRLTILEYHPYADLPSNVDDVQHLRTVLKGIAAQMINGPGAAWTDQLEAELLSLAPPPLPVRLAPDRDTPATPDSAPSPASPPNPASEISDDLAQQIFHAIAANPGSAGLNRAMMLAAMHEVSPAAVLALIHGDLPSTPTLTREITPTLHAHPARKPTPFPASPHPPAPPVITTDAPARSLTGLWLGLSAAMLVSVGVATFVILRAARPVAPPRPIAANSPPQQPAPPPIGPDTTTPAPPPSSVAAGLSGPPNPLVLLRDLATVVDAFDGAAASVESLRREVEIFHRWWPRLDVGPRTAAIESLVEAAYKPTDPAAAEALLDLLIPARLTDRQPIADADIHPMFAGAGLLSRLSREREVPPAMRGAIDARLTRVFGTVRPGGNAGAGGGGFVPGIDAIATALAERSISTDLPAGPAEQANSAAAAELAADRWLEGLQRGIAAALTGDEAERQVQLVALPALERILTNGPDLLESPTAFRFVSKVLLKMRYRPGDPSQARIVAWLGDARLSLADAHVISQTVVRANAPGVDASMVLQPTASPLEREGVRAQFASAWGIGSSSAPATPGTAADADWLTAARAALAAGSTASLDMEHASVAAAMARLCAAAALRARGEPVPSSLVSASADALRQQVGSQRQPGTVTTAVAPPADNGAWAIRYLVESRTPAAKLAALAELPGGGIDSVSAAIVAEQALTAGSDIRNAAQAAAERYADSPVMLLAVLDVLHRAPRSLRTSHFLSKISQSLFIGPSNPRWNAHYRQALAERILTLTAAESETAGLDGLAAMFADAYAIIAGNPPTDPAPDVAGPAALRAAAELYTQWEHEASRLAAAAPAPVPLSQIRQRRAARQSVAQGVLQQFIAEQVSTVEVLAALVQAERPARADEVRSIIEQVAQQRRAATTDPAQLRITQEAMLRLWAIRLGETL
ncbi:MAG: hypothetical protein MUE97_00885 [Phycisphaerales bacterium]|jgi:hypothetical protein|nr:hypothetical protein [Phycisphaerales bacterium]